MLQTQHIPVPTCADVNSTSHMQRYLCCDWHCTDTSRALDNGSQVNDRLPAFNTRKYSTYAITPFWKDAFMLQLLENQTIQCINIFPFTLIFQARTGASVRATYYTVFRKNKVRKLPCRWWDTVARTTVTMAFILKATVAKPLHINVVFVSIRWF